MHDGHDDILIGYARMAEFAQAAGYKVTRSTLAKRGSPAINTGPEIIGYFGHMPASTKGRMRAWLQAQLRPERPPSKRWAKQRTADEAA